MGVVYKARDLRLDRLVCIKILHPEQMKDESRKQRFIQEAKSASSLNHPNIVTIHEIDQAEGTDFMVMDQRVHAGISAAADLELNVAKDKIVTNLDEIHSDIWMLDLEPQQ